MQVTDARKMSAAEIAALMKKKAFDEEELSPRIQAGTDAMFGRHMTAAQVVDQIVADVRKNGDESLFYYTKLIDRVELTPENIRVTERLDLSGNFHRAWHNQRLDALGNLQERTIAKHLRHSRKITTAAIGA